MADDSFHLPPRAGSEHHGDMETASTPKRPRIIIVGRGFGGLYAARALSNQALDITPIDRKNHHTFQPLLYQVALAVLSPGEIASPLRHILRSGSGRI